MGSKRDLVAARAWLAGGLLCLCAGAPSSARQTSSYVVVDNIEESWVNLNLPAVRPMFIWGVGDLYAVNVHDSTVSLFTQSSGQPDDTWRVPWGPVSIAGWMDPFGGERLLVVCSGSYVLAVLDRNTGETVALLDLPPEPRDILVDQLAHQAYVSCAAQDLVVEIDLAGAGGPAITRQWTLPVKNPLSLAFDGNGDVLVAPLFSGNNSGIAKQAGVFLGLAALEEGILDLADATVATPPGLPDRDALRIVRSSGQVETVAVAMGTILLAQGVNPATGRLWQVGTDANNKDPNKQSEPAINGESTRNILSIANLPATGNPPNTPLTTIDLDDSDPLTQGVQIDTTRTVGQPVAVHFDVSGFAFVAGLLTDNVTLLDPNGNFVLEWDLPPGSLPRQVLYSPPHNLVLVYCWGTNKIETYHLNPSMTPFATLDCGYDPTPQEIRDGRAIYYSAFKSRDNNASCNSCHVEGKADNLVWNLSDDLKDAKGPMMTQLLTGIDRLVPLHWRGERKALIDFNPAFEGLLGSTTDNLDTTPGGEFDDFEAFVLSLRNPANPNQDARRLVSSAIHAPTAPGTPTGNAVDGQPLFIANQALNCERCHNFPMATNNEIVRDDLGNPNPREQWLKVTPFHEIYRKQMDSDPSTPGIQTVTVNLLDPNLPSSLQYPETGFGFAHAGVILNLHHFVRQLENPGLPTPLSPLEGASITDFIWQWDNGLAPAVHRAFLLNQATEPSVGPELATYLVPQAQARNCDIAVYGVSRIGAQVRELAWFWDRHLQPAPAFVCEDVSVPPQPLSFFTGQAQAGDGDNVFVGVPVGMAERFAVDFDADDLYNHEELVTWNTDPYAVDSDGDTFWDGHEVHNGGDPFVNGPPFPSDGAAPGVTARTQWFTSMVASLVIHTDEPTTAVVSYAANGGTPSTLSSDRFGKQHRIVLPDLLPSNNAPADPDFTYTGTVSVTDLAGNPSSIPLPDAPGLFTFFGPPPITTRPFVSGADAVVVNRLRLGPIALSIPSGGLASSARITLGRKTGGPPFQAVPGLLAVCRILKDKTQVVASGVAGPTGFSINGTPYTSANFPGALSGPFVIAPVVTDANGLVTIPFSVSGFQHGELMTFNIEGFGEPTASHTPQNPDIQSLDRWSMPDTAANRRFLEFQF